MKQTQTRPGRILDEEQARQAVQEAIETYQRLIGQRGRRPTRPRLKASPITPRPKTGRGEGHHEEESYA